MAERQFTYDTAGNVISEDRLGDIYSYTYNAANRMDSLTLNGTLQAEYIYNALGQQVVRRLIPSGQVIHSIFDLDGNRIAEYDAGSSTLIREYVWMNGSPVAVVEGGVTYYIRTDHIGRPVFATDDTGAKVWESIYLPFGGVLTSTGTPIALRFPGQWFQSESGLHQNWMRDYDPTTGRYMQADPLGLVDGPSVYGYALQNPGRYVDPRGEQAIVAPLGGLSGIGRGFSGFGSLSRPSPIIAFPPGSRTDAQQEQSDVEYGRYKNFCENMGPGQPPPRSNTDAYCAWLQRSISHASQCITMINNFDQRWNPGRHSDNSVASWVNRIQTLQREQELMCDSCDYGAGIPIPIIPPILPFSSPVQPPHPTCLLMGTCELQL